MSDKKTKPKQIFKIGHRCKVVLTKLSPTEINKYTRKKCHEKDSFKTNDAISKSRKRKYATAMHVICDKNSNSDSECLHQCKIENFNTKQNFSKKILTEKHDFTKIKKLERPNRFINSVMLDKFKSQDFTKSNCLDSSLNQKRKKKLVDDSNILEVAPNRQSKYKNTKCLESNHVLTTINVNFYYNDSELNKDSEDNIRHETNEESHNKCKYASHVLNNKPSKLHYVELNKTKDEHLHKNFFKIIKIKNRPIEPLSSYTKENRKLNFTSSEDYTHKSSNNISKNESNEFKRLEKIAKLHTAKESHSTNHENKNTYVIINPINSSLFNSNHETESVVTENAPKICSVQNETTSSEDKTSCHTTIVDSLTDTEKILLCTTETISKINSNKVKVINNNGTNSSITVNNNKIGKIRVKDEKSLGIQLIQKDNLTSQFDNKKEFFSKHKRQLVENMSVEELISSYSKFNFSEHDIVIFRNYKKYFDELLESKLLKMGELLHLVVTDFVRKDERIQRAEKLSSLDLIKQEKFAAETEFDDILRTRGVEFTNLLESSISKFDKDCAEDMILSLYCRILDMFLIIDKQNKRHIIRARYILQKMLHKSNYKNGTVCKVLSMKGSEFSQRLSQISYYVLTYNNLVNAACGKTESEMLLSSENHVSSINTINKNIVKCFSKIPFFPNCHGDNSLSSSFNDNHVKMPLKKSQCNINIHPSTYEYIQDQDNSLSSRLSDLTISGAGTLNNSTLNLTLTPPFSFDTSVLCKNVSGNTNSNNSDLHYYPRNNVVGLNYPIRNQHKAQADVGIYQNTQSINDNLQHSIHVKNVKRVDLPFSQISENKKRKPKNLEYNDSRKYVLSQLPVANPNSSRQFIPHYFHNNQTNIPNTTNTDFIKTAKIELDELSVQKDVNMVPTRNTSSQSTGVFEEISSFVSNCQKTAQDQLQLPYTFSPGPELLRKILSNYDNSFTSYAKSENKKNIIGDRVYFHNHPVGETNVGTNEAVYNDHEEKVIIAHINPVKIPQSKIYKAIKVHNTKTYKCENMSHTANSIAHKFMQMVTADKADSVSQNKLPVISDVFSCATFSLTGQDIILSSQDSIALTVMYKNDKSIQINTAAHTFSNISSILSLFQSRNVLMTVVRKVTMFHFEKAKELLSMLKGNKDLFLTAFQYLNQESKVAPFPDQSHPYPCYEPLQSEWLRRRLQQKTSVQE